MNKELQRNYSLDIIRIVAFCSVAAVHFFLNTDFYNTGIKEPIHFLMVIVRTFTLVCVPLFLLLSGYLLNTKTLSKNYYKGIIKTLSIYLIASIICYFHNKYFTGLPTSLSDFIFSITSYKSAKYSWYIEMYIGLFLLIPFLNLVYNNIKLKKDKQVLIVTLIVITMLPSVFNTYNFTEAGWWLNPAFSNNYNKLIPDYWINFYPITYYYIGAYLNEFKPKIKPLNNLLMYLGTGFVFGVYCIYRSYGHIFISGAYQHWNGLLVMIISVLLFILLVNIKTDNFNKNTKKFLSKLSNLTLGAYLISSLCDDLVYNFLSKIVTNNFEEQFKYYLVCVSSVIILSYLLSYIINVIYDLFYTITLKSINLIKNKKDA